MMDEIEILMKKSKIQAIEELRNESGFYLYSNLKNYQPERLSEKTCYDNEEEMRLEEIHFPVE